MSRWTRWLVPSHPAQLALGLTLWSLWFVAVYGGLSVACALAPPALARGALTGINAWMGLLTLTSVALLAWLAWHCYRGARRCSGRARFVARLAAGLHLFAAVGVLFVGLPIAALPPCH